MDFLILLLLLALLAHSTTPLLDVETERVATQMYPITSTSLSLVDVARSPCRVTNDVVYGGLQVDCSGQSISSLPLPQQWIPSETTTLLLTSNSISQVGNDSFSTIPSPGRLRRLDMSNNHINAIQSTPFGLFASLESLDLSHNKISLDRTSISVGVFNGLRSLLFLNLDENGNEDLVDAEYPNLLFHDIPNLSYLVLDTFSKDLNFNSLLNDSRKLEFLVLSGGVKHIKNESFQSFSQIKLKALNLNLGLLIYTESGAFRYLSSLDTLSIDESFQETKTVLESLAPFVNRSLKQLKINRLNQYYVNPNIFTRNSIINKHTARFLSKICVENVSITNSKISVIEFGVFNSPTWAKCLKHLDISGNPLVGEVMTLIQIHIFQHLKSFKMTDRKFVYDSTKSVTSWSPPRCTSETCRTLIRSTKLNHVWTHNTTDVQLLEEFNAVNPNDIYPREYIIHSSDTATQTLWNPHLSTNTKQTKHKYFLDTIIFDRNHAFQSVGASPVFTLPKEIEVININSFSSNMLHLDDNAIFKSGENLRQLHTSGNGLKAFTGSINGLENLELLDISNNDASIMNPNFFKSFPSLLYLNMRSLNIDPNFMAEYSDQLLAPVNALKVLDLSDNQLHYLKDFTFSNMSQISVLILFGNRFQSIPFHLKDTPKLCLLDIRGNSLRTLSKDERDQLENHHKTVTAVSLKLDGNAFYCGCKNIRFLAWLQRTNLDLDNNRNYTCVSDSGRRINTLDIEDLEALWRICQGEQSFWITLNLVCFTLLAFVIAIVLPKMKTRILTFIAKSIFNSLVMKKINDYPVGVYIGYADVDTNLACLQIRPYIEKRLGLSTYVRHRDLLPASDIAQSIIESIHSSWRILIVVSEEFLKDSWSYFLMKAATHAVSIENPDRLVLVLVQTEEKPFESSLMSKLPSGCLHALHEESIIRMSRSGQIDNLEEEALVKSLLDNGGDNLASNSFSA